MIKLVAFDWNGTILADTNVVINAETKVLAHFGYPATNLKQFQATYTIPIRNYWIAMGIPPELFDKNTELIHKLFQENYEPLESKCRTRSGSNEVLSWLKSESITTVIFSNHIVPHIDNQLSRLGLREFFDGILARELGDFSHLHNRGKDIKLRDYVIAKNLEPSEVITVGDTDEEIAIAKQFGYLSAALTGGYQSTLRIKAAKPDFLIHNLTQLKDIIQKL